jgi:hypothetical protein
MFINKLLAGHHGGPGVWHMTVDRRVRTTYHSTCIIHVSPTGWASLAKPRSTKQHLFDLIFRLYIMCTFCI